MGKPFSPEQRQEWADKIRRQQESGLSVQSWCRENQIVPHLFHYWKRRLFLVERSSFVELNDLKECTIDIQFQSVRIQIESPTLKQAFRALKELGC